MSMKSGFISIVGKTNAGKSSLINALTGNKISICTPKPQTTRNSIQGIYNDEDGQIVFIDTPGFLNPHQKLDRYMNRQVYASLEGIDGVILLIDAGVPFVREKDLPLIGHLRDLEVPLIVAFNKIDLTNVFLIENLKKEYSAVLPKGGIVEISVLKGVNLDLLLKKVKAFLPEGDKFYPDEMKSDHPLSFLVGEIVREQILLLTQQEIPHSCAVKIERMVKNNNAVSVDATIVCERESQKRILVGKQGNMIRRIGTASRKEIEKLLGRKVHLTTFVRVEERWRDSDNYLREFGYDDRD